VSLHEECLRRGSGKAYRSNENPHSITLLMGTFQFLNFSFTPSSSFKFYKMYRDIKKETAHATFDPKNRPF